MKKLVLTIASALFISVLALTAAPAGDNNDNNSASHNVSISIPTVALVDVEGEGNSEAGTINLSPDISSLEAGSAVDFSTATNSSLWLNYTSIVEGSKKNPKERNISVQLDDDKNLPEGISIVLSARNASTGQGQKGQAVSGNITLTKNAQDIVTGIGSCYTESGYQKGHQLTYALNMDIDNYADLLADSYEVEITYTITGD